VTKTTIQWPLVLFSLLATGGAGILASMGLSEFHGVRRRTDFIALIVALILIVVGGGLFVLSTAQPSRMMALLTNVSTGSMVSLEFLGCGVALIVAVVYLFIKRAENPTAGKVIGVISVVVALAFGFVTGFRYETMLGTPEWHTPTISLGFMLTSLLFGGFCYEFIASFGGQAKAADEVEDADADMGAGAKAAAGAKAPAGGADVNSRVAKDRSFSRAFAWILTVLAALSTILYCVHIGMVDLTGNFVGYILLVVVVGGACSLLLSIAMVFKPQRYWVYIGFATTLVGGLAFRAFVYLVANPHLLGQINNAMYAFTQTGGHFFA